MSDKLRVYLANPYGFSQQLQQGPLADLVKALEAVSPRIEVWEPFARNNQVDFTDSGWAYGIGRADRADVENCDAVFAVVTGMPPDDGVAVEVGMAIALNKPVFLFRDDFRSCCDSEGYPLNLMWFTGMPQDSWSEYYYTSVREIADPFKAFYVWATEG